MESWQYLDVNNEIDMYCLHLVFVPVIQTFMNEFLGTWNVHPIRTTRGNKYPQRLFNIGTIVLYAEELEKKTRSLLNLIR